MGAASPPGSLLSPRDSAATTSSGDSSSLARDPFSRLLPLRRLASSRGVAAAILRSGQALEPVNMLLNRWGGWGGLQAAGMAAIVLP